MAREMEDRYKLPEAYDAPGAPRSDRRFAVALERYKTRRARLPTTATGNT
jgi:hypothetical protein